MTVPIDGADFVDLLERAAWAFSHEDWTWFLKALSPPVQRRMLEEFFHWQTHGGQAEPPGEWQPCSRPGSRSSRAGRSPDRADAMVWAMSSLVRPRPEPRIRTL